MGIVVGRATGEATDDGQAARYLPAGGEYSESCVLICAHRLIPKLVKVILDPVSIAPAGEPTWLRLSESGEWTTFSRR